MYKMTLSATCALCVSMFAITTGTADEPAPNTQSDVTDLAFDAFCPTKLIGDAWAELDSSQLTDVALLLQYGEATLGRERRGVSAEQVARLAVSAAVNSGDQESLKRLAKAAERFGSESLQDLVQSSLQLASASRDIDPGMTVFVDEIDPLEYKLLHSASRSIRRMQIIGDPQRAKELEAEIALLKRFSPEQQAKLKLLIDSSRAAMPPKPVVPDDVVESLNLLTAMSRPHASNDGGNGGDDSEPETEPAAIPAQTTGMF